MYFFRNTSKTGMDSSISINANMLGLTIDPKYCRNNLFKSLDVAREKEQFLRIDMEGFDYTQSTIDLFKEALTHYSTHVGLVIQAYLHRSKQDIPEFAKMGADIQLCKGAYNEPENIVLPNMDTIRLLSKDYLKILLDKTDYPRIAT